MNGKSSWRDVTEAELVNTFGRRLVREAPTPVEIRPRLPQAKTSKRFDWRDTLKMQLHVCGLPEPVCDYRFHPTRRFLMDLAWIDLKVSCEVDGGEWAQTNGTRGRHGGARGMQSDCEKLNEALRLGWRPFRFTGSQVQSGYALDVMDKVLR